MTAFYRCTNNVHVYVELEYDASRSIPEQSSYVFSYTVTIKNESEVTIQIMRRSWIITDAFMNIECVEGEGVVGQQPIIAPGQGFSYTSYCPLKTSFGSMKGFFYATTRDGRTIKIEIPEFVLAHPHAVQ